MVNVNRGSVIYTWLYIAGILLFSMFIPEYGNVVMSGTEGAALAPPDELAIFVLGMAAFVAWLFLFPKFTGVDPRNLKWTERKRTKAVTN